MRSFTKAFLMLLLCMFSVLTTQAKTEKVHATFEAPTNTNTTWTAGTKTFTWSTTYYNQLKNIGLPTGDLTKYKKLVVDCEIKSGNQFRILFYKGGSNLTLYASNGVNEFILADTLKSVSPNDYNEYLLACDEICLSGNNNAAPGEAVINDVYLETYDDEGEKVYATFEAPTNTNTTWTAGTKTFTWSTTYYNQLKNIGLPSGDITKYKKLVVDCEIKSGNQFRILFYKGGSNLTLYASNGVNEFILADTLKSVSPNDYNEYLLACDEICLSGNNNAAPGEAVINSVYLETYPENESVEIPDIVYEEDPGKPEGEFVDFTEVFSTLQPRIGLGTDGHPIVLGNGEVIVGQRTKDVIADLSAYSKLTMVTSPNLKLVLYMNHEVDALQNANEYAAADSGKYVFLNVQANENGIAEVDLTQFAKQDLNCICLPWDNNNKGTVWYLLLTAKAAVDPDADTLPIDIQFGTAYNDKSVQNYTTTWTATKDGKTWTLVNFNNNQNGWNSVKCGRKDYTSVASITSPAINAAVKSYVISLTAVSNVNTAKLAIMNGENLVGDSIDITEKFVAGEVVVPVEGQKGYSYVLTIDNKSGKNGSVEISKILLAGATVEPVEPVHIANTAETAYTVAKAIELIDAGEALNDSVFVKGIVSQVDEYNDQYKNINYWISDDGTTQGAQFECFRGKGINGAPFAAISDVEVGAEVIVKGLLTKYQNTYEFKQYNELVSYKAPTSVEPEPQDSSLIEIAQDQGKTLDTFARTELVLGDDYNTYTCTEGIQVAFKMFDINVKDCDYVIVKFAEPVAAGWELAFWGKNDNSTVAVPAGATEYKYVFAEDAKCAIENDVLPQVTMLRLWSGTLPLVAKVAGVYKHKKAAEPVVEKPATPIFTPAAGEYTEAQKVAIVCETEGAAIYYTIDGTAPTAESTLYADSIAIAETTTVKAIAIKDGQSSEVAEATYTINIAKPVLAEGKYYLYNVAAQGFVVGANNWGTRASITKAGGVEMEAVMAADDKYELKTTSLYANCHLGTDGYVDNNKATQKDWTIAPVEGQEGVFTLAINDSTVLFWDGGEKTTTSVGKMPETAANAYWKFITPEQRLASFANATAENPVDATFLIQNPNFSRAASTAAWKMEASNQNLSGGANENMCAESYHSVFTLSQTLSNAPAGKYKMTAQGFYRQDGSDNENLPVFYANDKTGTFPLKTGSENNMNDASASFTAGQYTIEPIEVTVFEDGQLTVGAKLATNTSLWCIFDNFRLTYLSSEIPADEFKPAYENALAAAQAALVNEAYTAVIGEERTALDKAIADFDTIPTTTDSVKLAISTLNAATSTFTGAKGAYEALAAAKALVKLEAWPYAAAAKKTTVEEAVAAVATSAEDATAKTTALQKAYRLFVESNALAEGVEGAVIYTDSIKNPAFDEGDAGWTVTNMTKTSNEPWTNGEDNSTHNYMDKWNGSSMNISVAQDVTLTAGKYVLTAIARATEGLNLILFAGEATDTLIATGNAGNVFNRGWNDVFVVFEQPSDGTINIGMKATINNQWASFSNFRLVKFPATAEEIALHNAIDALTAIINADKTIVTEGQKGAEELANAIATAETAAKAADATIESIAAARAALASAVATFTKANLDADLIEIEQTQSPEISDGASRATVVEGDGYTQYTTDGGVCVIIKKYDIDVKDCDYITIKFAEPLPNGINAAFWAQSGTDNVGMPAGTYEYKYVFADDAKCAIANDILPQLTLLTLWNSQTVSIAGVYKHKKAVEIAHTWDFTKWSEETVANLKADAAASKLEGWSDVEKQADAEAGNEPTETSKDNCFWATIAEGGELKANDVVIEELKGLQFGATFAGKRSLAIAVNYASTSLGEYHGASYLWLGGKNFECFTIPAVKGGTTIKMGVESHKPAEARGVQLFAGETELKDADDNAVAAPKTYTEQSWVVPAGVAFDIVVKNTNGCHIYFIDAEQDEATLTAISTLKSNDRLNGTIYNLNGQKMNKAQRGLYIINGKKVVVK